MSGRLTAQRHRGAQTVVLAPGRHLYVDHGDVRPVRERLAQEVVGVAGLGDDVEARLAEQPREAFPQKDVVLSDHDSQRSRHRSATLLVRDR